MKRTKSSRLPEVLMATALSRLEIFRLADKDEIIGVIREELGRAIGIITRAFQDRSEPVSADGVRAYPIAEVFKRLGIKNTNGFALIKSGELATYTVGRYRYCTEGELQRFIRNRIEHPREQWPVEKAVKASLAARRKKAAA